jgi:transcriptional regulator with XRE-family HTH domain
MLALKARRERVGLSCAELGRLAGLGVSYVGMMERGQINTQISTVLKLVQIIDTKQTLDPRAVSELRDLFQVVQDLRGWIKNTSESLKRAWLSPAKPGRVIVRTRRTGGRAQFRWHRVGRHRREVGCESDVRTDVCFVARARRRRSWDRKTPFASC